MKNFGISRCFVLLFVVFSSTSGESIEECKKVADKSSAVRLKKYLFCNYFSTLDEEKNNVTAAKIEILPKFATMDEHSGNLELNTWIYITWKDENLSWDPSLFDNAETLRVPSGDIWLPDIATQSSGKSEALENVFGNTQCEISSDGSVGCAPTCHHTIRCQSDFTLWPYDRHNCTLLMSSWRMKKPIIFEPLNSSNRTVFMFDFVVNGDWNISVARIAYELVSSHYSGSFAKLSVDFVADRTHGQLSGRYTLPGVLISILTLTTLWLEPRSSERLGLACLNPIIHLLCIHDLNWVLPSTCDKAPKIVIFYSISLVLSIVALVLTLILGKVREAKVSPPSWISAFVSFLLRNKIGSIFVLDVLDPKVSADIERDTEDGDNLVDSKTEESTWIHVVVFLSWIIFLGSLFAYILTWTILIPDPSMKSPIIDISERF